jgi:tetratricopeptide (TPR) repeat protein
MVAARKGRSMLRLPYPDNDAVRASIREMMGRRRNPRLDIARMRLNEARKGDPTSPELFILDGQLRVAEQAKKGAIREVFDEGASVAPVPELFHADANRHRRNDRKKALGALERGVSVFPDDGRLHRRLGGLYLSLGRSDDAIRVLKKAQQLEPMMPDSYSLLGELWASKGPEHWDNATTSLDEALRLAPEDPHHKARKADLLRRRARFTPGLEPEARDSQLEASEVLLREALVTDAGSWKVQTLLAGVILDRDGDIEQAEWLLKKALKSLESVEALTERARVLVRRQAFPEARQLLERAAKKSAAYHPAHAVLGEVELGQGQVFLAFEAYKKAVEVAGEGAAEAAVYSRRMQELGAMIESGVAAEMLKQAQGDLVQATDAGVTDGPRRDAGSTTILRKREQEAAEAAALAQAATDGAAAEAAPAEASAEAAPTEAPAEAAPAEAAPAESAPADGAAEAAPVVAAEPPAAEPALEA